MPRKCRSNTKINPGKPASATTKIEKMLIAILSPKITFIKNRIKNAPIEFITKCTMFLTILNKKYNMSNAKNTESNSAKNDIVKY